jgi:hypothetical protein
VHPEDECIAYRDEILSGQADSVPVVSYWDWPTDVNSPKEVVVERILDLEEERIRQLFSVNCIESNSIAAAEKVASFKEDTVTVLPKEKDDFWYTPEEEHLEENIVPVASQCADTLSESAIGVAAEPPQNYWYFPPFKVKERVAEAVMEEERIRQMLTVNHIQERLMEQSLQNTNTGIGSNAKISIRPLMSPATSPGCTNLVNTVSWTKDNDALRGSMYWCSTCSWKWIRDKLDLHSV